MKNLAFGLVALLLCTGLCAASLSGCSSGGESSQTDTTTTSVTTTAKPTTTVTTTTAAATTTTAPTAASSGIVYTSSLYGYSLTLPASWDTHYLMADNGADAVMYEKASHDAYQNGSRGDGKLFTIKMIPSSEYHEDMFPSYVKLGEKDSLVAVWLNVTDVRFDEGNAAAAAQYQAMMADLPAVQASFSYL